MSVIFFVPLSMIAFYEYAIMPSNKNSWMKNWLRGLDEGDPDAPEYRDPEVDPNSARRGEEGLVISRVKFQELISVFPNTEQVCIARGPLIHTLLYLMMHIWDSQVRRLS